MKRRRNAEVVYARQGGAKVHVVGNARQPSYLSVGRCGAELWGDEYPAHMVPEGERCQAGGCRAAWPPWLRLLVG